jgi:hypothetical protein
MNTSDRLVELATFYHREARRCERGRAFMAASVMVVAAFEAAIQAMCFLFPAEVKTTTVYAHKRSVEKETKLWNFRFTS